MCAGTDAIRVLHVDDDAEFADMAATYLEREDERLSVRTESGVSEARSLLADAEFDCVVSDYELSELDGIELLSRIRNDGHDVPFILYTGKGSEAVAGEAVSAGATDYLQKGTGTSQYTVLANRIANVAEGYRARRRRDRRRRRRERQSEALLDLAADETVIDGEFEAALRRITETAAEVLSADRVGVWLFEDGSDTLRRVEQYDRGTDGHEEGTAFDAGRYPAYFDALASNRSIAVADAREDSRPSELRPHPDEHGVRSLLDATIRSDGEVVGVVCHEHLGERREWTDDETEFAGDVADLVRRVYTDRRRAERERALQSSRARFRALTENTEHVVLTIDDESVVRYVNDAVEDVLGYAPDDLVGESLTAIVPERYRESHMSAVANYLDGGDRSLDWDRVELPGLHSDGSEVPLGISFGEATLDGDHRFTAVMRDSSERNRRERDLEASRRRFDAVFNTPFAFMALLAPDGTVTNVNRTALEFVDRAAADIEGKPFPETPWWDHSASLRSDLRSWIDRAAEGEVVRYEADHYGADGERVTVDGVLHPIRDDGGAVTSLLAAGRDVSERTERERILDALTDSTSDLIAAESPDDVAELTADAATDLLDLPHTGVHLYDEETDTLAPAAWTDVVTETIGTPPALGPESIAWDVFESGATRVYEDLNPLDEVHNPDTPIRSELIVPLGEHGVVIVAAEEPGAFDDTDRRLIELLCGNATATLERVRRESQLRRRERELKENNERLEQFASVVSHDLRNPLNVAAGHLDLVAAEHTSDHLDTVASAHDRMQALIDDLLTLARESAPSGEREAVDLDELVAGCWTHVDTADATLATDVGRAVRADTGRLKQLVENLVRNAIEHGGEDVTVRVGVVDDGDGFYVADDGPGVPESDRDRLFEPGYSTSTDGTGFGLSIVEQVATAHGWDARVVESADGGARFEFADVAFVPE